MKRLLIICGLMVITAGCLGIRTQHFQQTAAERDELLSRFPVVGAWSEPADGLRCRVLAASSEAVELGSLRVALDVENAGPAAVKFTRNGCPPFSDIFRLDGRRLEGGLSANAYSMRVRLEPGQTAVLIATDVGLGPARDSRIDRKLSAALTLPGAVLAAPPIQVRVKPVEWGPTANGLRMNIRAENAMVAAGQQLGLSVSVDNVGNDRLLMREWGSQTIECSGDQVTARFSGGQDWLQFEGGRGFVGTHRIGVSVDEPGTYRLCVVLDAPNPWRRPRGEVWRGRLVSNEVVLNVLRPEEDRR